MDNTSLLIVAMAEQCKALVKESERADNDLPQALHPQHLLWMCEQIEQHAEDWGPPKLHRWIGFVQAGMLANGMLDFEGAQAMFDAAKNAYGANGDDDLIDHLDPASSFNVDIGGEG